MSNGAQEAVSPRNSQIASAFSGLNIALETASPQGSGAVGHQSSGNFTQRVNEVHDNSRPTPELSSYRF